MKRRIDVDQAERTMKGGPSAFHTMFGVASSNLLWSRFGGTELMTTLPEPDPHTMLEAAQIPVGEPLAWPLLDQDGRVLLRAGDVVATDEARRFLVKHFSFYAGATSAAAPGRADRSREQLTLAGMRLSIGSPIGLRRGREATGPVRRSKLIGFSPERMLLITTPGAGRSPLVLTAGEPVQVAAIGAHAVYSFSCTVLAVCSQPFDYLVLSEPGSIRLLRERKAVRVHTRLAVRYGKAPRDESASAGESGREPVGLGLGRDLSVQGMSLVSGQVIGGVGTRVRVSFPISTAQLDTEFEASAVVRYVKENDGGDEAVEHGLQFEDVTAQQQFALRSYLFDCLSASMQL